MSLIYKIVNASVNARVPHLFSFLCLFFVLFWLSLSCVFCTKCCQYLLLVHLVFSIILCRSVSFVDVNTSSLVHHQPNVTNEHSSYKNVRLNRKHLNRISANYKTNLKTEFVTSKRQTNPYKPYIAIFQTIY